MLNGCCGCGGGFLRFGFRWSFIDGERDLPSVSRESSDEKVGPSANESGRELNLELTPLRGSHAERRADARALCSSSLFWFFPNHPCTQ